MLKLRTLTATVAVIAALSLTGCTSNSSTQSSTPKGSTSATSSVKTDGSLTIPATDANVAAEFAQVAKDSCAKAQAEGVVQKTGDGYTLVMVPKDKAVNDLSAAYLDPKGKAGAVYESDAFYSCEISMVIELASEAGYDAVKALSEAGMTVKKTSDTVWSVFHQIKTDGGAVESDTQTYTVKNGLIVSVVTKFEKAPEVSAVISYGYTAADLDIIKKAKN
jgi:hypothetical protein